MNRNRKIAFSLGCSNWGHSDRMTRAQNGSIRCPHCGSVMTEQFANEQQFFETQDFKINRLAYLMSREQCEAESIFRPMKKFNYEGVKINHLRTVR